MNITLKSFVNVNIDIKSTIISNKSGLTLTISVNNTCIGQPLFSIRYLWHETPCLFKQAALSLSIVLRIRIYLHHHI